MSSDRRLGFLRRLALLGPVVVGCAAPSAPIATSATPEAAAPSAASASAAQADPTTPCRCAWDTDAASAPRICADREIDHAGAACLRGADHTKKPGKPIQLPPVVGPLAPPELAS